jgi:hypothetical protein
MVSSAPGVGMTHHLKTCVQLVSICCQISCKTEYYDTEQSQANQ